MANSSTSLAGTLPSTPLAHPSATRSKGSLQATTSSTRISYTVAGAWSATTNPPDVPSNALIHGRVTT
jgi:hypothetical protein